MAVHPPSYRPRGPERSGPLFVRHAVAEPGTPSQADVRVDGPYLRYPGVGSYSHVLAVIGRRIAAISQAGGAPGPLDNLDICPAKRRYSERRRRDSNPRYPIKRYNTLAGCRFQPLSHSSVRAAVYQRRFACSDDFWLYEILDFLVNRPSVFLSRRPRSLCRVSRWQVRRRGSAGRISLLSSSPERRLGSRRRGWSARRCRGTGAGL